MFYGNLANDKSLRPLRKYYSADGSMEIKHNSTTRAVEFITYIGGDAYDAPLYVEKIKTIATGAVVDKKYYLHRDYLGSIIAISDETGAAIERRLFDAWGNLAKLQQNGAAITLPTDGTAGGLMLLDRGYTGHEHLAEVGLIHMNGRLYDPILRSFLMPDNFIQQPENTQNYNRYAYVLNNPLMYTDPSGELLVEAIIIGTLIAGATYTLTALLTDVPFTVGGLVKSMFIGAASAAVTYGIGCGAESMFTNFYSKAAFQALAHGTFQGGMTAISGGKFWSGFAAGALSSIASSAWQGGGATSNYHGAGSFAKSGAGMIAFGTVSGGVGARLTGGNFWQGAVTGLVVSGLNHAMHQIEDPNKQLAKRIASEYGYDWREVKSFLDANPFELTHKGVAMGGKEALSSKYIENDKTVIDYAQDQVTSEVQSRIIEYLSPRAGKIWGLGSELLSSQTAHAPDSNYLVKQNQRIMECKETLIRYYFQKPATVQTPSMFNNQQSVQYHSSRFDIMQHRHY
ncbi:RHS repeat-associated core domain-containing protein [Flavobacterium sp. UMI-01]|uniref:RHS repeat-associated core domain-containing protein n=1 Tax=Flavobacterium sp. UMI-01 TaxID=1441053 RepID=UPI001C7CB6B0|nr:RHS repeat-associated core domain-containing protein [Flavobacterium sp. UMI-01]GIZ07745.1 hypothetical protein FUMI01_04720 [Flavobacterium sp. UMI-01]